MADLIQSATEQLFAALHMELGLDITDVNFTDTPKRVSRMYREILAGVSKTDEQVKKILESAFPCDNDQLVLVKDIEVFSICPHHLLPVHYKMHIAYLPKGKVLGISKLPRLAALLAKRPVLQEQLVNDITNGLMSINGVLGAACIAEGVHYCMVMRGAKQSKAVTVTSSLKGIFLEDNVKQELLKLIY